MQNKSIYQCFTTCSQQLFPKGSIIKKRCLFFCPYFSCCPVMNTCYSNIIGQLFLNKQIVSSFFSWRWTNQPKRWHLDEPEGTGRPAVKSVWAAQVIDRRHPDQCGPALGSHLVGPRGRERHHHLHRAVYGACGQPETSKCPILHINRCMILCATCIQWV